MKRILSLALAVLLALTGMCLSSCAEETLESVDGMTPGEYLTEILDREIEAERYDVVQSMQIEAKAFFVSLYNVDIERLYVYSYDGQNESRIMPDEAVELLIGNELGDIVDDYDGDVYFFDGYCYISGKNGKEKYESSKSSIGKREHEKTLTKLLTDEAENVVCSKTESGYRFTVELTDPKTMKMGIDCSREVYNVYVTESGVLEQIMIECITGGFVRSVSRFSSTYIYEGLAPLTPPADADQYEEA